MKKSLLRITGLFSLLIIVLGFILKEVKDESFNTITYQKLPFAVVELFTSEGCSSCPPADALLADLKSYANGTDKNIYVLSFHVDYWNRLGWRDPFSDAAYSARQTQYDQHFGSSVYTPQMIVNGKQQFVGSEKKTASEAIAAALKDSAILYINL